MLHIEVCWQVLRSTTEYVKKVVQSSLLFQEKLHLIW